MPTTKRSRASGTHNFTDEQLDAMDRQYPGAAIRPQAHYYLAFYGELMMGAGVTPALATGDAVRNSSEGGVDVEDQPSPARSSCMSAMTSCRLAPRTPTRDRPSASCRMAISPCSSPIRKRYEHTAP